MYWQCFEWIDSSTFHNAANAALSILRRSFLMTLWIWAASGTFSLNSAYAAHDAPFSIRVVDEQTNGGVPLVELKTTSDQTYLTDSNGYVAIDDPTLMGQQVFFHVSSHGYELPKDGFGFRGTKLNVARGKSAEIRIQRIHIAERLYRVTGAGIYRDSIQLGKQTPIAKPLLNAFVTGQDSVQAVVHGDRIYWFWGDTDRLQYPLGQFNTSGAVSLLPQAGGLDPALGVDLDYFTDESGFSRPMFKRENGILIWVHGVFIVNGPDGKPKILTHYSRRKSLEQQLSHGLAALNLDKNLFEPILPYDKDEKLYPRGHAFRYRENDTEYICFADPYAVVRVRALWDSVIDSKQYESFTPFKAGSSVTSLNQLDRDDQGRLIFGWKRDTVPPDLKRLEQWVQQKTIKQSENWFRTVDANTGKSIRLHRGSIKWNRYRQRWVMIAHQSGGSSSFLGEVWYAEARRPEGPFAKAVKIVTHNNYSFYNVSHHDFFDQQEGRLIYFEGTYTNLFAKTKVRTPWYDYNQIMYRLDLTDARLTSAFVE